MKHFKFLNGKRHRKNNFFKLYGLILIPILVLFVFMVYGISVYTSDYENIVKKSYHAKLDSMCTQNDNAIQNILESFDILNKYDLFSKYTTNEPSNHTTQDNAELSELLGRFANNNSLIDSVFIYERDTNSVYSDLGTYKDAYFFTYIYSYADYSKSYWGILGKDDKNYSVLRPTLVNNNGTVKTILPMILSEINGTAVSSHVVINIDLDKIINIPEDEKLTPNSLFLLVNKTNRYFFSSDNTADLQLDNAFFQKMYDDNATTFEKKINGKDMLVLSCPNNSFFKNYTYVVLIPNADINKVTRQLSSFVIALFIIVTLITCVIAYFLAKSIYSPIETLFALTNKRYGFDKDANGKKQKFFNNKNIYSPFSYEMAKILPLMQEKYLMDFLNSDEHYLENIFFENNFEFEYNYFCTIIIRIKFTDKFYNQFNDVEYQKIKSGIKDIIYSCFSQQFNTYILMLDKETFIVILNFENENSDAEINKQIDEFRNYLSFDIELAVNKTAKSGIYASLWGLKQSYTEAMNNISRLPDFIKTAPSDIRTKSAYLSKNDEDIIYNHLMLGHGQDVLDYLDANVRKMIAENLSEKIQRQFYVQVIMIIFKVMKNKKINYDPDEKGDMVIISELTALSITEIHEFVNNKIREFEDSRKVTLAKVDTQNIIDYINENYKESISLDSIASTYNTTPKYISKVFKEKLGVNFVDYLANTRITEAKKLLVETDKSLWDILTETGFNNRNTFIRTFKKITGLAPSDYRKNKKNL